MNPGETPGAKTVRQELRERLGHDSPPPPNVLLGLSLVRVRENVETPADLRPGVDLVDRRNDLTDSTCAVLSDGEPEGGLTLVDATTYCCAALP